MRAALALTGLTILLGIAAGAPAASAAPPARVPLCERPANLGKRTCLDRSTPRRAPFLRAPANARVPLQPCAHAVAGGLCGSLEVPLDRTDPSRGTTTIGFELYPHTDPSVTHPRLLTTNAGGPGGSNTFYNDSWLASFAPVLDRYDLLLMDDRGRGSSDVIDCPQTQHGIGDYFEGIAACGAKLGDAAGLYGTAASVDDLDDVRAALGYDKLTFYGVSYGGVDIEAYATRHPEHLEAVVADAPWTSRADPLQEFIVPAIKRVVALTCGRAPGCAAQNPKPATTLGWLAHRLQREPLTGTAPDLSGEPFDVTLDEATMLGWLAVSDAAGFAVPGELTAAARALRRGDDAPLLRLAAEQLSGSPFPFDSGDAEEFSAGAYEATWCADSLELYDTTAPPDVRRQQYDAALAGLPPGAFAPFSVPGYALFLRYFDGGDLCIPWPSPRVPVLAPDARYPAVPTLVLSGDVDAIVPSEYAIEYATRWPRHTFVRFATVGHDTLDASACATDIINHFLATHRAGDTSCATEPLPAFTTPDFPRAVAEARAARRASGDASRLLDRRAATVAALTVLDALKRVTLADGEIEDAGLRGGSFTGAIDEDTGDVTASLDEDRFAGDLAVSGAVTWTVDGDLTAHVTLSGAAEGELDLAGPLLNTASDRLDLAGTLSGRTIAVSVPST